MRRVGLYLVLILSLGSSWGQEPNSSLAPSTPSGIPDSAHLEAIKTPKPQYPDEARDKGLQGRVVIRLHVDEEGKVESTDIVSGNPILARAAADAFKKWKFKPFIRDGKPVKVVTELPFLFTYSTPAKEFPGKPPSSSDSSGSAQQTTGTSPQKIRASARVAEGQLIHKVDPIYPPEAKRKGIEGTVLLLITIGKDGALKEVKLISGPPELADAAIGAVQQWRYRPYLLDGNPVEVESTVKVTFHL